MTASVSDAELAQLIAGLATTPPAPPAAPCMDPFCIGTPGGGCGRTPNEHLATHGAAAIVAAGMPDGGRKLITSPAPVLTPAGQAALGGDLQSTVYAAVPAGPPPSTVTELRQVLIDFEANRPRSMQKRLGPSELGTPCQQQMARKLAGAPRQPITEPTWAPFQGTAVHASMEDVVAFWNKQLGRERWLAEDELEADPGMDGVDPIRGHGDAFDVDYATVVDWKYVGTTALDKLRRGKRLGKPTAEQVSPEYRVQGHVYGLGHARKGRDVRYVRLVLLARSWKYDDSEEWTEPYNPDIAFAAIDRYYATHDLLNSLGGTQAGDLIAAVPAAPHRDTCKWCPFYTPGRPTSWAGCAGDRSPDKHVDLATDGLIARPS